MDNETIFDNTAAVVNNKTALIKSKACERALGSKNNVIRASTAGLQNSDLFRLMTAHLLLTYCLENDKSTEQVKEYKAGLTDFVVFMAKCAQELEADKLISQQPESKT